MKIVCGEVGYSFVFNNCKEMDELIKNLSNYSAFAKKENVENEVFVYVISNDAVPTKAIQDYAIELKELFSKTPVIVKKNTPRKKK